MHVAELFVELGSRPLSVVGPAPFYVCLIDGVRIPRAIYLSNEDQLSSTSGGFDIKAPRQISVRGRLVDNPALIGLDAGTPVRVMRDGYFATSDGWFDHADYDYQTGWVTLHCRPMHADLERTNHGTGIATGWISTVPPTVEEPNPDGPLIEGGWGTYNVILGSTSSEWGYAVTAKHGPVVVKKLKGVPEWDQPAPPWHFAFQVFDIPDKARLRLTALLKLAHGVSHALVFSMILRDPVKPESFTKVPVSIPTGATDGQWTDSFDLASVEGPGTGVLAFWSGAPGFGENACSLRAIIVSEDPDNPDTPATVVKHGGGSVDLVGMLANEAFRKNNRQAWVTWVPGTGQYFEDGMLIEADNYSTYGSLISQWSSDTEYRWIADTRTLQVGAYNYLGSSFGELRAQVEGAARAHATALSGSSSRKAGRITITASTDDAKYAHTDVLGAWWDEVRSSPTGIDPVLYGQKVRQELSVDQNQVTLVLDPPPGGRSSGDWLARGLKVGDRVPAIVPGTGQSVLRITGLKLEPVKGDRLTATVETVHP